VRNEDLKCMSIPIGSWECLVIVASFGQVNRHYGKQSGNGRMEGYHTERSVKVWLDISGQFYTRTSRPSLRKLCYANSAETTVLCPSIVLYGPIPFLL